MKHTVLLAGLMAWMASAATAQEIGKEPAGKVETRVSGLLAAGKQVEAEDVLDGYLENGGRNQRLVFLRAACLRSRFAIADALPVFVHVESVDSNSLSGLCAGFVARYDQGQDKQVQFDGLRKLADRHPEDVYVQWLMAVICRSANANEIGAEQFERVLKFWKPGPVLVHQTYANMLDELHRYENSLEHRKLAVQLEPAGWSYDGLGNTLTKLAKYAEADTAHAKATSLDPERASYWANWAFTLLQQRRYAEAEAKCRKATEVEPDSSRAWSLWGDVLRDQDKSDEAAAKFKKAEELNPQDPRARMARMEQMLLDFQRMTPEERKALQEKATQGRPPASK